MNPSTVTLQKFAKLFETETTQVLIHIGRDESGFFPKMYQWFYLEGVEVGMHLEWPSDTDESFNAANDEFEKFDQTAAEKLVENAIKVMKNARND